MGSNDEQSAGAGDAESEATQPSPVPEQKAASSEGGASESSPQQEESPGVEPTSGFDGADHQQGDPATDVGPGDKTVADVDSHRRAGPGDETLADANDDEPGGDAGVDIPEPSEVGDDNASDSDAPIQNPEEVEIEQADSLGDLTGRTLSGRYELVERIGGGGMGEVYRAEHTLIKKQVAIKLLYPELAGDSVIERFRREAQASAHIDHPNICASTDFGETEDGIFYLVMEYLDGRTLDLVLEEEGTFAPARTIHVARQICAALEQADELDIIHRDLKPENVMLVRRGSDEDFVKLLDFGIARVRMGQEAKLTQTGMVFGTPNFMSPEQAAGDRMDHRADLYAVGLLMFQMLTGRPPFQAERGSQVMAMHVSQEPPTPSDVSDRAIPDELETLVLKLLNKEPDDRPDSATKVRETLDELYLQMEGMRRGRPADRSAHSIDRTQQLPDRSAATLDAEDEWMPGWAAVRMPWPIAAAAAVLAVVIGAGAALGIDAWIGPNESAVPPAGALSGATSQANLGPLEKEHRKFLKRPVVRRAMRAYRNGSNQAAIDQLESLRKPTETQPHLEHQLGRLYADNGDWVDSMTAYRQSLSANPEFLSDPELINDVFTAFQVDDESVAEAARRLLAQFIHRERIQRRLVDLAWKDDAYLSRKRAHELLRDKGVVARLPAWERLSIELRHSMGCKEHREVIERLVQLGDPRGLRVLRIYDDLPKSGCGRQNQQDCYGCIRKDLREAIETLSAIRARKQDSPDATAASAAPSNESTGEAPDTQSSSSNNSP